MAAIFNATDNPKQLEFIRTVMASTVTGEYLYVFIGGAIRGGKTSITLVCLNILCKKYPGSRWHIIRESMGEHEKTLIPSFEKLTPLGTTVGLKRINRDISNYHAEFHNGSKIFFSSENIKQDRDLEWMKGLETNGIFLEQMEGLDEKTFDKALERTGSWIIDPMPPAFIFGTFNPTQNWVKAKIYDPWSKGELKAPFKFIEAFPGDNPYNTEQQYAGWKRMHPITYQRFIEGNWAAFEVGKPFMFGFTTEHIQPCELNPDNTVYLSFDFNVDPVVCLVVQWGKDWIHFLDEYRLKNSDLYEMCARIKGSKYGRLYIRVTGDATGMERSVTTKGNINSYTIIKEELRLKGSAFDLPGRNPPIEESRTLSNAIWSNHPGVKVDPKCKFFIEDCRFVQVKDDGTIDKRDGERSHLLDAGRYFFNTYKHNFILKGY